MYIEILILLQGSWEKKILERIHNVTSGIRKRQLTSLETEAPVAKRGRPKMVPKATRYPPLSDTGCGDDDITIQRNHDKLQKEVAEKTPRKEVILALARQTFSFRRTQILSEDSSISATALLEKFGELKKVYVVSEILCVYTNTFNEQCLTCCQDSTRH